MKKEKQESNLSKLMKYSGNYKYLAQAVSGIKRIIYASSFLVYLEDC